MSIRGLPRMSLLPDVRDAELPTFGALTAKQRPQDLMSGRTGANCVCRRDAEASHATRTTEHAMTRRTKKTMPTVKTDDATARTARIAATQRRITEHLNAAGDRWQELETELALECEALTREILADRTAVVAKAVATELASHRVNTGTLSSRLVDALEAKRQRVYPPLYETIDPRWAIVESR